jgi:hypothetical protein
MAIGNTLIQQSVGGSGASNYITSGIIVLMLFIIGSWIYQKNTQNKSNCDNMNALYSDFSMVHTINTNTADFKYSLRDYYIKTAYNCCSAGQFKNDFVNVCALKNVIKQGARCLDFEIYSLNNDPVIATSSVDDYTVKETYNSVAFKDMLDIIRTHAFSGSTSPNPGDPIILHMRIMSNNKPMYEKMAKLIELSLPDLTLGSEYSYENNGKNIGQIPLSKLMGKVVIIVDRSNPLFESTKLDEYVNLASNSIFMRAVRYSSGVKYTPDIDELIYYNKKNMTLVMPDISGVNTNYSPQLALACGSQFVSLCFQNFDTNMEAYSALFDKNGTAFVLKPESLRYIPATVAPPTQANPEYSYKERNTSTDYYSLTI